MQLSEEVSPDAPQPCERCGTFARRSLVWQRQLCDACIERASESDKRELSFGLLVREVLRLTPRVLVPSLLVAQVAAIPTLIQLVYGGKLYQGIVYQGLLSGLASVIIVHLCLQAESGAAAQLPRALGDVGRRFGVLFRTIALSNFYCTLLLLLLVVPGVLRWFGYLVALPIALFETEHDARTALRVSRTRMQGSRVPAMWIYGLLMVVISGPSIVKSMWAPPPPDGQLWSVPPGDALDLVLHFVGNCIWPLLNVVDAVIYKRTLPGSAAKQVSDQLYPA